MELFWAPTASVFDTENKEDIDNSKAGPWIKTSALKSGNLGANLALLVPHQKTWMKIYMAQKKM